MRFLCTVTTLLIVQCLNPGIYGQSPPYKLGALVFDQPSTVRVGESVKLKCEYFLYSVPDVESDLRISFVPNSNLSEGLKSAAKSTNFNFPQEVGTAHEDFGEVLEKAELKLPLAEPKPEAIVVSNLFTMSAERSGSYICQIRPKDGRLPRGWILTKWFVLEAAPRRIYPWIALLAVLFLVVVLFTFVGVLFWMTRPFKVVFMKVELKPSPLYASGERQDSAKGSSTSAPSSITPVVVMSRTTMPPLRSVLRALYRQRKIHNLTELDGKSRDIKDDDVDSGIHSLSPHSLGSPFTYTSSAGWTSGCPGGSDGCCDGDIGLSISQPPLLLPSAMETAERVEYVLPVDPAFEIPVSRLKVKRRLGQGAFGIVFHGTAVKLPNNIEGPIAVAVKTLRVGAPEHDVRAFIQEIEMLKAIGVHENIIQLYATTSYNGRPIMIMEYAAKGSLLLYLRKKRAWFSDLDRFKAELILLDFALQVAQGMAFLASKWIVHRDLAARNVVMTSDWKLKIVDFGLTRKAQNYYRMTNIGLVPIKWMSPESVFDKVFTVKSDVWSFGVLMWEIFSLGENPAADKSMTRFLDLLKSSTVPPYDKPVIAPMDVFDGVMVKCWNRKPTERPSFSAICSMLSTMADTMTPDIRVCTRVLSSLGEVRNNMTPTIC